LNHPHSTSLHTSQQTHTPLGLGATGSAWGPVPKCNLSITHPWEGSFWELIPPHSKHSTNSVFSICTVQVHSKNISFHIISALYKDIILQCLHFSNWLQIYIVSTINIITYMRIFEIAAGSKNISRCRKQPELPLVFKYSFRTDFVPLQWCPVMSKINFAPLVTYLYNRNTKNVISVITR
jgi:hypothetical protein